MHIEKRGVYNKKGGPMGTSGMKAELLGLPNYMLLKIWKPL
jgi:hypothetical protein